MNKPEKIKAILIDLDGVLYTAQQPIAGAQQALHEIRSMGLQRRFITNTSTLAENPYTTNWPILALTFPQRKSSVRHKQPLFF